MEEHLPWATTADTLVVQWYILILYAYLFAFCRIFSVELIELATGGCSALGWWKWHSRVMPAVQKSSLGCLLCQLIRLPLQLKTTAAICFAEVPACSAIKHSICKPSAERA